MNNQQFINQVKDLLNYYVLTEKQKIESNMTYSGIGVTQKLFADIDAKAKPLQEKIEEVAKKLK